MTNKKLKTLKDFNVLFMEDFDLDGLKDAAREWIKHLEEFENKDYSQEVGFDRMINNHYYHKELLEDWIRHFFNLEESE